MENHEDENVPVSVTDEHISTSPTPPEDSRSVDLTAEPVEIPGLRGKAAENAAATIAATKPSAEKETQIHQEDLVELRPGSGAVDAKGFSFIKRTTRAGNGKVHVTRVKIPIKPLPAGIGEDLLVNERPTAPSHRMPFSAGSPMAKMLGATKDGVAKVYDGTDPGYIRELESWLVRKAWAKLALCIDLPMFTHSGAEAASLDDRIDCVKNMGFTDAHVAQINTDIDDLTRIAEEERHDFFGGSSD